MTHVLVALGRSLKTVVDDNKNYYLGDENMLIQYEESVSTIGVLKQALLEMRASL